MYIYIYIYMPYIHTYIHAYITCFGQPTGPGRRRPPRRERGQLLAW